MCDLNLCPQIMLTGKIHFAIYDFKVSDCGTECNVYIPEIKVNKIILLTRKVG